MRILSEELSGPNQCRENWFQAQRPFFVSKEAQTLKEVDCNVLMGIQVESRSAGMHTVRSPSPGADRTFTTGSGQDFHELAYASEEPKAKYIRGRTC